MNNHNSKRLSHAAISKRRGATIVEFALIVPILLAMLLGIIEFAWMARSHLMLANAAREGARAAAVGKTTTEIRTRVTNMATGLPALSTRLTTNLHKDDNPSDGYTYTTALGDFFGKNDAATGGMIRVQCVYQHRSLTNFIPLLNKTVTINVVMRREG